MGLLRRIAESRAARGLAVVAGLGAGIAGCNEVYTKSVADAVNTEAIRHKLRVDEEEAGKTSVTTPITIIQGGSQTQQPQYREVEWVEVSVNGKKMLGWKNCQGYVLVRSGINPKTNTYWYYAFDKNLNPVMQNFFVNGRNPEDRWGHVLELLE